MIVFTDEQERTPIALARELKGQRPAFGWLADIV